MRGNRDDSTGSYDSGLEEGAGSLSCCSDRPLRCSRSPGRRWFGRGEQSAVRRYGDYRRGLDSRPCVSRRWTLRGDFIERHARPEWTLDPWIWCWLWLVCPSVNLGHCDRGWNHPEL